MSDDRAAFAYCKQLTVRRQFGRVWTQPPRPTQPPTLSGTGNEYRPKCGNALRPWIKGRMVHSIRG